MCPSVPRSGGCGVGPRTHGRPKERNGRPHPSVLGPALGPRRSWATGALVYLAAGFLSSRVLLELLGSEERLESFSWRLALLHVPALTFTLLTALAAARMLPDEHRPSRLLYLLAALAVPVAGLAYGFAVAWEAVGIEGVVMPVVSLAAGAASGVAVDRLVEERATRPAPPPTYSYNWRDSGATATEYLGVVALVVTLIGAMAMAGVGGQIGERIRCAISALAGGGGSCTTGGGNPEARPRTDADYEPKVCQISSISDKAGGKVTIGWFEWGEEYGFQGYAEQPAAERSGSNAAVALKVEDGIRTGMVSVQLNFATGVSDAAEAAAAAGAGIGLGATRKSTKDVRLTGPSSARDARRIDYDFTAGGQEDTPKRGTPMTGVLVAGVDSGGVPFVVRLNAVKGAVEGEELDAFVGSIAVK